MSRPRVLVVDDDADVRAALAALIARQADLELVGSAAHRDEALRVALETHPDVVLMDVKMRPGGPTVTRELLRAMPEARVVALSAYDDRGALLQMIDAGAVGYLVKGCRAQDLVEAVHAAVRGDVPLSPGASAGLLREVSERLDSERGELAARQAREHLVHRAIGGLQIVFQPIVRLNDGGNEGFEALSRFPHLDATTADVFAAAAGSDQQIRLEATAVAEALAGLRVLPHESFLTLNVSPAVLMSGALDEFADGPLQRVVVEITEHAPVEDYDRLRDALAPWRERGARVAVDDAGAGFASLRHILRLAPDFIKLDGALTAGLTKGAAEQALAAALVTFAEQTGSRIVAEAVETAEQVGALRALRVELGQGMFLGRPRPAEQFAADRRLREYEPDRHPVAHATPGQESPR